MKSRGDEFARMDIMILLIYPGVTRESVSECVLRKEKWRVTRFPWRLPALTHQSWPQKNLLNLVHKLLFSFAANTQTLRPEDSNSLDIRQSCSQRPTPVHRGRT